MSSFRKRVGRVLRDVVAVLLIGAGVGVIFWLSSPASPFIVQLLVGAWFALCIYASISLLAFLLKRFLERLSGWRHRMALAAMFFVSASFGWTVGFLVLARFTGGRASTWAPVWLTAVALGGGLGVVVGLAFTAYERLKARLEESVARIKEQEFATRELETARQIQSRILPPPVIAGAGYRIAARNEPARVVAGDFYDVFPQADGTMGLVVADVSGKGVGASLVMASVKAALPLLAAERSVTDTLDELNRKLLDQLGPREFVALCLVRYEPWSGKLEFGNAGLPDPYLLRPGSLAQALSVAGPRLPLGVRAGHGYQTLRGRLQLGERLLLLTDGLPEAVTGDGEPLGYERLEQLLLVDGSGNVEAWLAALFVEVDRQTSASRDDDWTALALERQSASTGEPGP